MSNKTVNVTLKYNIPINTIEIWRKKLLQIWKRSMKKAGVATPLQMENKLKQIKRLKAPGITQHWLEHLQRTYNKKSH